MKAINNSALSTLVANGGDVIDCIAVDGNGRMLVNLSGIQSGGTLLGKAHDAASAAGDVGILTMAVRRDALTGQTSAAGDFSRTAVDAGERIIVCPYSPPAAQIQGTNAAAITNTTSTQILSADVSFRRSITDLSITNESAVNTRVDILDGATVIWRAHVSANSHYHHTFNQPLRGSINTALNAQCATTASSVFVSVTGFNIPY